MPKVAAKQKMKREKLEDSPPEARPGISAGNVAVARKGVPPKGEGGRSPFMLRFDNEVYVAVKDLAERVGVSANQLMEGLARWAVKNSRVGIPVLNEAGDVIGEQLEEGYVWAGEMLDPAKPSQRNVHGVWMLLDFTKRRVVREDM
jgi:hypothetical protein